MNKNRLSLEISIDRVDSFDGMKETYRDEGMSVGPSHLRLQGEDVQLKVLYRDLVLGAKIGYGACSSVYVASHKRTGAKYAIKMFSVYDQRQADQLKKEIVMLSKLNQCDALLSMEGVFHQEGSVGVILEFMNRGSLESFLGDLRKQQRGATLPEAVIASITFQVLWGLGYLHFENKLHRDVKPGNVLLNSRGLVKLSDFGISKELSNTDSMSNTAIGTFRYMSPERLMGERYDSSGDIWAVGLILIELHSGSYPFQAFCSTPVDLLDVLEPNSIREQTRGMSRGMGALVGLMLCIDPKGRRSAQDLVSNPWFNGACISALEDAQQILEQYFSENKELGAVSSSACSSGDAFDSSTPLGVDNKLLPKSKYRRSLEDSLMAMSVSGGSNQNGDFVCGRRDEGAMDSSYDVDVVADLAQWDGFDASDKGAGRFRDDCKAHGRDDKGRDDSDSNDVKYYK